MSDDPLPPGERPDPTNGPSDVFDSWGRPVRVHDRCAGHTTWTVYDAEGRPLSPPSSDGSEGSGPDDPFVVGG